MCIYMYMRYVHALYCSTLCSANNYVLPLAWAPPPICCWSFNIQCSYRVFARFYGTCTHTCIYVYIIARSVAWFLCHSTAIDTVSTIHTSSVPAVGDMAAGHIAGLAFGGQQPHSPSEHVVDPNVLVIHSVKVSCYSNHSNVLTYCTCHLHCTC